MSVNPIGQPFRNPMGPVQPTELAGVGYWLYIVRDGFPSWEGPLPSEEAARTMVTQIQEQLGRNDVPEELKGITTIIAYRIEVHAFPLFSHYEHQEVHPIGFKLPHQEECRSEAPNSEPGSDTTDQTSTGGGSSDTAPKSEPNGKSEESAGSGEDGNEND